MHVSHSGFRAAKHGNFAARVFTSVQLAGNDKYRTKMFTKIEKDINCMQMKRDVQE